MKKYLAEKPRGSGRWYYRRQGSRETYVPIRGPGGEWLAPETPEFDNRYWQIHTGKDIASQRSLSALIKSYRGSPRFLERAVRTRADYERVMDYLEDRAGPRDVSYFTRSRVIAAQEANKDRTRFANYIPQVLSVLFEHAIDIGWLSHNPAKGVRKIGPKGEGYRPWPEWALRAYEEACETPRERLAYELGIGTGQRPSDLVKMRWSDYDGEGIEVTQGKTGVTLFVPCTARLKAYLDATPKEGLTILTSRHGRPLTYSGLAQEVGRVRKRAGIEGYSAHGWRKRAVIELIEAGCTDAEVQAITGHATTAMVQFYRRGADQQRLARKAQKRR